MAIVWHTEDCCDNLCGGGCHEGELSCQECGTSWEGERDDAPDSCPECGEPWDGGGPDSDSRACERRQMGIG